MHDGFEVFELPFEQNRFEALATSVTFDEFRKQRKATTIVAPTLDGSIPIVRTTTRYTHPAQLFRSLHYELATRAKDVASMPIGFNNALVEIYTNAYSKMGAHSDQALDLEPDSAIAIFSCYQDPEQLSHSRELSIELKGQGTEQAVAPNRIRLTHNSLVVFSVSTNRRYRHKIVLPNAASAPDNKWLGVTFRTSNTFISYSDGPKFADQSPLRLATDEETKRLIALRGQENREGDFVYPQLRYTLSESDLLPPTP